MKIINMTNNKKSYRVLKKTLPEYPYCNSLTVYVYYNSKTDETRAVEMFSDTTYPSSAENEEFLGMLYNRMSKEEFDE